MISIVLIGYGNVAFHLTNVFLKAKNIHLKQVYARNIEKIKHLKGKTDITDNIKNLKDADLYIIAVSDNAIDEVSSKIKTDSFVVHTSGAQSINALKNNGQKGVFYMLQSFSMEKEVNFNDIPFCLEAENKQDLSILEYIANEIGKKIFIINSEQRQYLHVSAVFVNNFVNHLYTIGYDICKTNNVPFEVLHPLIEETAKKAMLLPPKEAQTGPAKRNDTKTINKHLSLLDSHQQEIYKILTASIQNEY